MFKRTIERSHIENQIIATFENKLSVISNVNDVEIKLDNDYLLKELVNDNCDVKCNLIYLLSRKHTDNKLHMNFISEIARDIYFVSEPIEKEAHYLHRLQKSILLLKVILETTKEAEKNKLGFFKDEKNLITRYISDVRKKLICINDDKTSIF